MSGALARQNVLSDAPGRTVDVYPGDVDERHKTLVRWFEESEMARMDEIKNAEIARAYYDGSQWTQPELDVLKERGQPPVVINKISTKIAMLCGLERKARTDPKAFPRTPEEDDRADAATQALRFIADDNNFSVIRSQVFENILIEGAGGAELGLEDDGNGGCNITITTVPWDRIWYDPHSRAYDFEDARYLGLVIWMDRDQVEELYPGADDVIDATFSSNGELTYRDRPDSVVWTDNRRQRVRIVQCHWKERGTWYTATFSKHGMLADILPSPFKDRRGKSACGLLLQSAYIDRENRRYGMVRGLISLQDEINKRRSKALHLLSVRQVIAEQGAVQDVDKARREVARPDGYIEITPGLKFEIEPGGDLAKGQFDLLQHATQEMQLSGPNAAMSGTDSRELSGRAILAQQAGGAVQNEPLADSLRMWSRRLYEVAWMAARERWTGGKWVRLTDDLRGTQWIGINQKVTLQDALAELPDQQRAVAMQRMQLVPGDPRLQQVVRVDNRIDDMDVDITVEEGPSTPTQQSEEFQTLVQLASMQPGLIPGDVLIAASSLKDKDQLLKRMQEHQQQQAQVQQQAGQMAQQHAAAEIAGKNAKAAADQALAKERAVNAAHGVHDMHADFSAPPYGQPFQAPPDAPSAPGTVGPAAMASHASGGLVTRTAPDPNAWIQQLPTQDQQFYNRGYTYQVAPNFRTTDPSAATADPMEMQYPGFGLYNSLPPQNWAGPPRSHATGGPVTPMSGGDPRGPDNGYITAKQGEYVLQQSAVARYGQPLLDALNSGKIDPAMLTTAAAHADADLRVKNAQAAMNEAKAAQTRHAAVNTIADTHNTMVTTNRLARTPIPQPPAPGASP